MTHKLFKIDIISRGISQLGDTIFYPIMLTLAASTKDPTSAMLFVSLSEGLPILLSVLIGAMADKTKKKYERMQLINITRFVLYSIAAILFFKGSEFAFMATIFINFISDCFGKGYEPLSNALLVSYSSDTELVKRQSIIGASGAFLSMVGPLLGSVLLLVINKELIVEINALTFFASFLVLLFAKRQFQDIQETIHVEDDKGMIETIKEGFSIVSKDAIVITIISLAFVINLLFSPIMKIIIPLRLSLDDVVIYQNFTLSIGIIMATISFGIIVGSLLTQKFTEDVTLSFFVYSIIILSLLIVALGFANHTFTISFVMFLMGIVSGLVNTLFFASIMKKTPPSNIGVVTTVVLLVCAGGMVLGDSLFSILMRYSTGSLLTMIIGVTLFVVTIIYTVTKRELLNEPV